MCVPSLSVFVSRKRMVKHVGFCILYSQNWNIFAHAESLHSDTGTSSFAPRAESALSLRGARQASKPWMLAARPAQGISCDHASSFMHGASVTQFSCHVARELAAWVSRLMREIASGLQPDEQPPNQNMLLAVGCGRLLELYKITAAGQGQYVSRRFMWQAILK